MAASIISKMLFLTMIFITYSYSYPETAPRRAATRRDAPPAHRERVADTPREHRGVLQR